MGNCMSNSGTKTRKPSTEVQPKGNGVVVKKQQKKSKFANIEKQLIKKIYGDIAQRCKDNIITRESLEIFFHANGLMAELLFSKFDEDKSGQIQESDFLHAFEVMVKGKFEQKADVLFEFYNVDHSAGIRYSELLKILFSYPLPELNKMISEEKFLKYLGENMLKYYFGPQNKFQDRTILEDNSSEVNPSDNHHVRKYSLFNGSDNNSKVKKGPEDDKKAKKIGVPDIFKKDKIILPSVQIDDANNISSSTLYEANKKCKKPPQLKSNISSITKRYATYLFVSLNLDKEEDVFSKEHFYKLMKDHPSIFDAHIYGFHTYIWQLDAEGEPQYKKINVQVQNHAMMQNKDNKEEKVYIKFIRTTIFVFSHKESKIPIDIVTMEGLTVEGHDRDAKYGIRIKHRDGFYREKVFMFDSIAVKDNWLHHLQHFKDQSVFDKYIKLERIGGGKFSNVFRGKDKINDKFVAIKVIQHVKLTQIEREVIKRQCGILKTCHHPNIIKFYEEFRTNTYQYIVTELLSQGDLFEYTKKNSFLQQYEAAIVFKQLTEAILYLNEEVGIIHRDLKPQNVMVILGEDKKLVKRAKLIDFGFGVYKNNLDSLTEQQKFAGTPGFIAPQVYQYKDYNQKIDTFSLGIILYFILYGYLPFQSNYTEQIQQMTLNCCISLKNNHWSNVSAEAKDLILKILTPIENRISTKQILDHPWLADIEKLKEFHGKNKKTRILF